MAQGIRNHLWASTLGLVLLGGLHGGAQAQKQRTPRIDPIVRSVVASRLSPWRPPPFRSGGVEVMVTLASREDVPRFVREAAHATGLSVPVVEGRALSYGRHVVARVDEAGLRALERLPYVRRVRLAPGARRLPLERSRELLDLPLAWGAGRDGLPLQGQGVLVADIDSPMDVFHPAFFHADAGWYDWIDVDGDGRFVPGVDAVDIDRNGRVDDGEVARLLRATPFVRSLGEPARNVRGDGFDPSLDWIYLDLNDNGQRDVGSEAGFDDATPAMGEPLFVPDDLDGDGALDIEERLVRLGTSKVRATFVSVTLPSGFVTRRTFRRGENLSSTPRVWDDISHPALDQTVHATGVAGILLGGTPLVGRRWVGIAPRAELVLAIASTRTVLESMTWALDQSPDVFLHEYVEWSYVPMDGSDPVSVLIDESTTSEGVTHVCPAGNIGGSQKHAEVTIGPGDQFDATFSVLNFPNSPYVIVSVHSRLDSTVDATLVAPDGSEHPFDPDTTTTLDAGHTVGYFQSRTPRGFLQRIFYVADEDSRMPLPVGRWAIRLRNRSSDDASVHLFLSDANGFIRSIRWDDRIATDASTLSWPSVADQCLSVGATVGHQRGEHPVYDDSGPERIDEVRAYSSRGPRIDGAKTIDVLAPDNPWAPLGIGPVAPPEFSLPPITVEGAFQIFGGTSGAGPHVAGLAALLVEAGYRGTAAMDRIRTGARPPEGGPPVPNDDYGYGILNAAASLDASSASRPPTLRLEVRPVPGDSLSFEVVPVADDPDDDPLEIRWDDGYDGTWETPFGPLDIRLVRLMDADDTRRLKARVRDPSGLVAEAAALVRVTSVGEDAPPEGGMADAGSRSDTASEDDDGCGCRIASPRRIPSNVLVPLAIAAVLQIRRRRRY